MRSNENTKKVFFFLRHNNDIDHVVPIIYKWLSTEKVPTDIVITTNKKYQDDYRIKYLEQFKHANIYYINDLFNRRSLITFFFNIFYFKYETQFDHIIENFPIAKRFADKIIKNISKKIFKNTKESDAVVVFDWTFTYFTKHMVKLSKEKKFTTITVPHGDWPYLNYLVTKEDLEYSCMDHLSPLGMFDYNIVANKSTFLRHEKYHKKGTVKILGSSRYCDEWLDIHSKLVEPYKEEKSKEKLKIIFFLRNECYAIFWEEVIRTIKLILQFKDVYLIVKHHPRNRISKRLTKKLLDLYPEVKENVGKNLEFIYDDVNSVPLLKWADVVIDVGTSMTFEAVKRKKPVLMLEYVHSNISTVANYIKASEINCRDQLYDTIENLIKNKDTCFYDEKERQTFIKEIIDVPDKKVLERHVEFLKTCLYEKR